MISLWVPEPPRRITMRQIAAETAEIFGVTLAELRQSASERGARERRLAWPRMYAMHRCRHETRASSPQIGAYFGGRDHSTVLSASERFSSPEFRERFALWREARGVE